MENSEILQIMESCLKAHKHAYFLIRSRGSELTELLEILQETAISVGEAIEHDYGQRQAAVIRLEEYCELLCRIHENVKKSVYDETEATALLDLSTEKIKKAISIMRRVMGIDVTGQFRTYYDRPKYADEVGIFSEKPLKYKTAIVLQGPIKHEDNFTLETIRLYKRLYHDCEIVISTWKSEEANLGQLYDEGITICLSELPSHSGALNCSYQAVSSKAGIEKAQAMGCERICKTRTDQRFYLPDLFAYMEGLIDTFPLRIDTIQNQRLIGISYTTFSHRLYHICDMFLYGDAEDVRRYFSCPLDGRDWESICWQGNVEYSMIRAGEIWFTSNYIESLGFKLKWTKEDSDYYRRELFSVIDTDMLDLYWAKYSNNEHPERVYNDCSCENIRVVTFLEWLNDFRQSSHA